jgi:hypothetical protein
MPRVARLTTKVRIPRKNPYMGFVNLMENEIFVASQRKLVHLARDLASEVRFAVKHQVYEWIPLTEKYKRYKKRNNLDPRILIATGEYIRNISVAIHMDGTVEIGVKDKKHTASGISLKLLARILEYGSQKAKIPPRPHWRPTISKFRSRIKQTKKIIAKEMNKKILDWMEKKNISYSDLVE